MNIEEIKIGGRYFYDNLSDEDVDGSEFIVTNIKAGEAFPVRGWFVNDPPEGFSEDFELCILAKEVSQFPIDLKVKREDVSNYRDRISDALDYVDEHGDLIDLDLLKMILKGEDA